MKSRLASLTRRLRATVDHTDTRGDSFSVAGATVLITGAASGMGLLHAQRAAADGAGTLVLWDRDESGLAVLADQLRREHPAVTVRTDVLDLADRAALQAAAEAVLADVGSPHLLVNNAGVVTGARFWEHTPEQIALTLGVNAEAPMQATRAFLPAMIERREPVRIVTVASAASLVANPRMSVYAASKWAALGWSDSLRLDLEQSGVDHVRVLTVCPSYISTGMFAGARGPLLTPIMEPEQVVARIWAELGDPRPILMLPASVNLLPVLKGLLPVRAFDAIVGRGMGIYSSMQDFTGRR